MRIELAALALMLAGCAMSPEQRANLAAVGEVMRESGRDMTSAQQGVVEANSRITPISLPDDRGTALNPIHIAP